MEAVRRVNALPVAPDFVIHTGDLTHLSKPEEFDTLNESLKSLKTSQVFFVPGEHDVLGDDGKQYLARYGKNTQGNGWFSFNHHGVHFVGLVNVLNLKAGGLGSLGAAQLEWLEKDVKRLPSSTPIVVFAHMPLWSIYPEWGWGTDDGAQALGYLKRFGSVTVLNGHIHQTLQKIEGHVTFHTAASTAFPQPAPGSAPSPGPMTVPADRLRSVLGLTEVSFIRRTHALPIVDHRLTDDASAGGDQMAGMAMPAAAASAVVVSDGPATIPIDNFKFGTGTITVPAGTTVTWINRDDVPHTVVGTKKEFRSAALDTDQKFSFTFKTPGTYQVLLRRAPADDGDGDREVGCGVREARTECRGSWRPSAAGGALPLAQPPRRRARHSTGASRAPVTRMDHAHGRDHRRVDRSIEVRKQGAAGLPDAGLHCRPNPSA